jgi:hypothetical protein
MRQHDSGDHHGPALHQTLRITPVRVCLLRGPGMTVGGPTLALAATAPQGWIALSDRGILDGTGPDDLLHKGLFVLEIALPLQDSRVLLDYQATLGWPRTFSLFHDPAIGLVLVHRQGGAVVRHVLPGPLPQARGTARLSYHFDAPARSWTLSFETLTPDAPHKITAQGQNPLPLNMADMQALCTGLRHDGPVLWFGLTRGAAPPSAAPWLGLRTPVQTSKGPVWAGNLKPGDVILTEDRGPVALRRAARLDLPARGSFAPVLLRSPFFAMNVDLLVSADQLVTLGGPETEYLFGEQAVLVPAGMLVDGRTALSDQRRAVTGSVTLELDEPALIDCNGCLLAAGQDSGARLPLRSLLRYEVLTLMSLMGRMPRRAA